MVKFKVVRNVTVDENYPFLERSFGFKLKRLWIYLLIFIPIFILSRPRFGFKIEGRGLLRKYKELLKDGAMTVSNHVHRWDFPFVALAVRYRTMYFPLWKEQLNGPDVGFIRSAGGIPVPTEISAMKYFNRAFDEIRAKKKWIHAFPESSRFDYYQPIRPFKKGVFTMAHRYNLPVLPMAFSYRKPRFPYTILNALRALTGNRKLPMITLRVGEPLLFDTSLGRKEAVLKMRKDCHEAVVRLAGIRENRYPAEGD